MKKKCCTVATESSSAKCCDLVLCLWGAVLECLSTERTVCCEMHLSNTMHDIMKLLKEQRVVTMLYSSVLFKKNLFK